MHLTTAAAAAAAAVWSALNTRIAIGGDSFAAMRVQQMSEGVPPDEVISAAVDVQADLLHAVQMSRHRLFMFRPPPRDYYSKQDVGFGRF